MGSCFSLPVFIQNASEFNQQCYTTQAPYHKTSRIPSPTTVAEMHEYYDL